MPSISGISIIFPAKQRHNTKFREDLTQRLLNKVGKKSIHIKEENLHYNILF